MEQEQPQSSQIGHRPELGIQGPVLACQDPWAGEASDRIMRTGTGRIYLSQDPAPSAEQFVEALQSLDADFYVHHMLPGLEGQSEMIRDMVLHGIDVCLGNEYGNINGPWVEGTNRWDVPDEAILEAARSGRLIGLLYDEPEHLQINAGQYRKDGWFPHWGATDGFGLEPAYAGMVNAVRGRVEHVRHLLAGHGLDAAAAPLVSEHVFPVMFHAKARAGMAVCPKIMKESFQALQLGTALGAAKQYGRPMWICADLWGPDIGHWFTRISGFPGHSPEEFESALRMGYLMGPTHLFAENIDVLLHHRENRLVRTEFGEAWHRFVNDYVPRHPLVWRHDQASADIAVIHSEDSNYGQNARLYGNRELQVPESSKSIFPVWHLLSHGKIPSHGSCMHIPGYDFPRHVLRKRVPPEGYPLLSGCADLPQTAVHTLFEPVNNALAFDEHVRDDQLGSPKLIIAAGSRLSAGTLSAVRRRSEDGAVVIVAEWLVPAGWKESRRFGNGGAWIVTGDFLSDDAREAAAPFLGSGDCWRQRFGNTEIRFYKADPAGRTLHAEIHSSN
ncbi:hypothetical protein ACFPYJ_31740 [Paenibacillus solisilvae]|uniref:Uncharacterized protein n=1 Tax=Paenibacillus solisilvae TaxID=2486751 RepID=A0ABW0WA53_9BACL